MSSSLLLGLSMPEKVIYHDIFHRFHMEHAPLKSWRKTHLSSRPTPPMLPVAATGRGQRHPAIPPGVASDLVSGAPERPRVPLQPRPVKLEG